MGGAATVGYLLHGPAPDGAPSGGSGAALRDALGEHTPAVEPDPPDGCWLDLRGGRRAPPLPARAAAVLATAREWGHAGAALGVAPTPGVARLAARHGAANPTILAAEAVASFLAPLPLAALQLDEAAATRLALVGLRTLGAIAMLPRGALGDFLGPLGPAIEALVRGEDDRPLVPARPPLVLEARRELDFALADRAALARVIGRLLAAPADRLRHAGLGATRATLALTIAGERRAVTVRLGAPAASVPALLAPLLAALPIPDPGAGDSEDAGGVTAVAIALSAPRPPVGRQASFYDVPQGRRGLLHRGLVEVRRRGEGPVGRLVPVDPHHPLPECRYALVPVVPPEDDGGPS